jgi:hypothetical protein
VKQRIFPILSFLLLGLLTLLFIWAGSAVTEGTGLDVGGVPPKRTPIPTPTSALPPGKRPPMRSLSDIEKQEIQPDLIVESITTYPVIPYLNTTTTISVTVMNIGSANVIPTNNFFVDFYVDPGLLGDSLPGVPGTITPWSAQGFDFPVGGRKTFTITYVFTQPYEHQLYAQVDTPEQGLDHWYGNVYEGVAGEHNNVFPPSGAGVKLTVQPRYSVTQGLRQDFYDNYASSVEVVPAQTTVYADTYGHPVTSEVAVRLGLFEEPPVDWGTWSNPPSFTSGDYNILNPDLRLNTVITNDQLNPKIACRPISGSNEVVVVWEDRRFGADHPDIYLRYAMTETVDSAGGAVPQHMRLFWRNEMRVNDDGPGSAIHAAPVVVVSENGNVVVAWQDNRLQAGNVDYSDVYFQQFRFNDGTHQLERVGNNRRLQPPPQCEGTTLRKPKIAQIITDTTTMASTFFLAWEGKCPESHSNIWLARSTNVTPGEAIDWKLWRIVNSPGPQSATSPDLAVALVQTAIPVGEPFFNPVTNRWEINFVITDAPLVAVAWEEDKGTGTGKDIYASLSVDQGETFQGTPKDPEQEPRVGDQQISDDSSTAFFSNTQDQPVLGLGQERRDLVQNIGGIDVTLPSAPYPALHFVWRDFRNSTGTEPGWPLGNNPDVYYRRCPLATEDNPPHPPEINAGACASSVKMNLDDVFSYQKKPPKQTNPAIAVWNYDVTAAERFTYSDVYVAWSDNRNYYDEQDAANYDVYVRVADADKMPPYIMNHNASRNINLNDEAKIHLFDTTVITDRTRDRPPAAWQEMPSIAVNAYHVPNPVDWSLGTGWLFAAWVDNRDVHDRDVNNPNDANNFRDVYVARSNLTYYQNNDLHPFGTSCPDTGLNDRYGAGSYISKAFDAGSSAARWYILWYQGNKDPDAPPPYLQTRVADTITDLLAAPWWPQTSAITRGCEIPIWGYIDSGADIISGTEQYPQGQYMQYRANFWTRAPGSGKTPELYWVRAYYDLPGKNGGPIVPPGTLLPQAYLPVIMKGMGQ